MENKLDHITSDGVSPKINIPINKLNIDLTNDDDFQVQNKDNNLGDSSPSYQKIIKICLLSAEDPASNNQMAKEPIEKSITQESLTESKSSDEKSTGELSNENNEKIQMGEEISAIKRSTSKIMDLIEEGQDLNDKSDIETKLESVYENGRVVEDHDTFEVILNVKRFLNGSMSVKSKGHHIFLVEAEADNCNDPGNKIYLTRRFFIPGRVDMQKTSTSLSSDGILVISVPKLPELKIPKRSDDVTYQNEKSASSIDQSKYSTDSRSSPILNDLESRFRDSNEKIRTESPSKLEELEARINARKRASEQVKILDEATKDTREKENIALSGFRKDRDEEKSNVDVDNKNEFSSRFRSNEDEDFFKDKDWMREKNDSKDWIRDYVGKYVDKDFFDNDRRRQESNKRRESRREWMDSKIKDTDDDRWFETKDIFGTKVRDFFKDDDADDRYLSRRSRRSGANDFFDTAFSRSRDEEFDMRHRKDNQGRAFDDKDKVDTNDSQNMFSSKETRRQFSSSMSTDSKNEPETERKESYSKQEFSSSSKSKSAKDKSDEAFYLPQEQSETRKKRIDDLKEEFDDENEFCFDFPIVRRGRFFQDSFFNDAKDDFDSVLDRFRQRFSSKDDAQLDKPSVNLDQQNKKQKTVICEDKSCFKIELPVEGIREETLTVKELEGNEILIEGRMKKGDEMFRKHIMFPVHGFVNLQETTSTLSNDDILTMIIPKLVNTVTNEGGRKSDADLTSCSSITSDSVSESCKDSEAMSSSFDRASIDRPVPRSRKSSPEALRRKQYYANDRSYSPSTRTDSRRSSNSGDIELNSNNGGNNLRGRFSPDGRTSPDRKRWLDTNTNPYRERYLNRDLNYDCGYNLEREKTSFERNKILQREKCPDREWNSQTDGNRNYEREKCSASAKKVELRSHDREILTDGRSMEKSRYIDRESHAMKIVNDSVTKTTRTNLDTRISSDKVEFSCPRGDDSIYDRHKPISEIRTFIQDKKCPEVEAFFNRTKRSTTSRRDESPFDQLVRPIGFDNRSRRASRHKIDNFIQREIDSFFGQGSFGNFNLRGSLCDFSNVNDRLLNYDDPFSPPRMTDRIGSFFNNTDRSLSSFSTRANRQLNSSFHEMGRIKPDKRFKNPTIIQSEEKSNTDESYRGFNLHTRNSSSTRATAERSKYSDVKKPPGALRSCRSDHHLPHSIIRSHSSQMLRRNNDDIWYTVEIPVGNLKQDSLSVTDFSNNEIIVEGTLTNGENFKEKIFFPHYCDTKKAQSILTTKGCLVVKVPKYLPT